MYIEQLFHSHGYASALALAFGVAASLAGPPARAEERPPGTRPNIVVVLADDAGWNDFSFHGSKIQTPNIDALAAQGAQLNHFYAFPVCSPTRVAFLTGRNPANWGVYAPLEATTAVQPEDAHTPQGLHDLGYSTHISGKWHLGEVPENRPLRYGFDSTYGYLRGQIDPYTHRYKTGDHVTWHRNDEFVEEEGHVTDLITKEAIRVIEESGNRPFFLYVAHHSPHYPHNEPPARIAPYNDVFEEPSRRHHAAAVSHVDDSVGSIIKALEENGKRENTLVIFLSDNGGQRSWNGAQGEYDGRYAPSPVLGDNTPLRGFKGSLYEGGIRVPAVFNWPGVIAPGTVVEAPSRVTDLAPTFIRLAGGEVKPDWKLEGADLWPLLTGAATDLGVRSFYWSNGNREWAAREGDWKLITNGEGANQLFNLVTDPEETTDVATANPELVQRLLDWIKVQRAEIG